jgi:REP-associated tyrosine transposase
VFPYVGCYQYFLTICTFERRPHFAAHRVTVDVRSTFLRTATEYRFAVLAYCFMPDHLHMLAEGETAESDLRRFVEVGKQNAAYVARRWVSGRLWQAGYFDRVLRANDGAFDVARYIVQNPVRAGLVRTAVDYPFTGSSILRKEQLLESTMWRPGAP